MSATNYTPIYLYNSGAATNTPSASNLGAGELAINYADGKLFYKDGSAAVQVIAWKTTPTTAGGTGLTSYTAGDLPYYASGSALSKLGIGTANYVLTSSGSAPQYVAQSTLSVGSATNATNTAITDNTSSSATWYPTIVSATTGNLPQTTSSTKLSFVPSTGTLTATSHAGAWAGSTIGTTYGGTGLTSFTANGVVYASSTSALATGTALTFDGTNLGIATSSPNRKLEIQTNTLGIRLNNTTAGGNAGIEMLTGASNYSWIIAAQYNISGLEFTRSTAVGGTTYSTPSMTLDNSGRLLNTCTNNAEVAFSTQHSGTSPQGIQITYTSASPNNSGTANTFLYCVDTTTVRAYISGNGAIYSAVLGTGLVYSNGGVLTSTNPSDERLKENITDLGWGLQQILALRPVSYTWKTDTINQGKQYGFIAQEVQPVMSDLVKTFKGQDENEYFGLDKEGIYATTVKAIQELSAQVTIQAETIATMQEQIVALTPKS